MSEEGINNENQNVSDNNTLPLYQLEEVDVVESEGVLQVPSRGAADVSLPRHDHPHQPHHHHHQHSPHEDELDLERELEILLQSPMLYSSQDLALVTGPGLPPEPQFGDVSLATLAPHGTPRVPTSIDELINTIFDDHHRPPPPPPPHLTTTTLPLLLPAPAPLSTTGPGGVAVPADPLSTSSAGLATLPPAATVTLAHKPRGSHGVWLPLNDSQRIRVTKGKGKRLRVEVRCNNRFTWQEMQLGLVECDNPAAALPQADTSMSGQECPDFFVCADRSTIQDEDTGGTTAVVEVHVSRVRAKLQFLITIQSGVGGWTWRGRTVPFITHNNGKDRVPRRKRGSAATGPGK